MSSEGMNKLNCFEQRRIFKKEKELLKKYFELVYDDLVKKENENELTNLIFCSYLKFPSIFSENLFRVINKSRGDKIPLEDFVDGLSEMMTEDIEKLIKIIFLIADFEEKGEVCVQDFKVILRFVDSYFTPNSSTDSLEKQFEALFETSEFYFLPRLGQFDFSSIVKINENFLQNLIETLMRGFPLTTSSILILKNDYLIRETKLLYNILDNLSERNSESFSNNVSDILKEKSNKDISSEFNLTTEQTLDDSNDQDENLASDDEEDEISEIHLPCLKSTRKLTNIKSCMSAESTKSEIRVDTSKQISNFNDEKLTVSNNFNNITTPFQKKGLKDLSHVDFEGCYLYNKVSAHQLQKIWAVVINEDIFIFNSAKDKLLNIIHIAGSYAETGPIEMFSQKTYYSFFLNFKNSILTFYCRSLQECENTISEINKATNYRDIYDHYEIDKVIGKGHFSEVRLGYSKLDKTRVAIKVIYKKKLRSDELESTLAEVEVLKFSKHQNIVKLIDTFDSADVLYIVLEYLENGNLLQFLNINQEMITYPMIKQFVKEIAEGVNYLHKNCIMHRDLKLENIMLNDKFEIKIVDLGFSKIVGKENKIQERLGTLTYLAPEVYQGKGYNKEADIWSLGIIMYYLVSGSFALDTYEQAKAFLTRSTFNNEEFYVGLSNANVSKHGIDLVMKCLSEQYRRINITQFLQHNWFRTK